MSDTLRTRIAQAIMDSCHGVFVDDAVHAADAVIGELGMGECDVEDCRCTHRYVTEWTADDV